MWFKKEHIDTQKPIKLLDNLHGYVLPHAGTSYTGNILSHTLQFRPTKKFKHILNVFIVCTQIPISLNIFG